MMPEKNPNKRPRWAFMLSLLAFAAVAAGYAAIILRALP